VTEATASSVGVRQGPGTPAIELIDLSWQVGGAKIVRGVNLSVGDGEIVGVIGPNGAGKTSLFNLISGINPVTSGTVKLRGQDVTNESVSRRARRGLGRTFQTSSLFPQLSVLENVRLTAQQRLGGNLSLLKFPRRDDDATQEAMQHLATVRLGKHRTLAGSLSHGDKRKLEIAVLLAQHPAVILLDEPMAGVSSHDVPDLTEVIRGLHATGSSVMIVEHHLEVVLGLVDRVAVMHHGEMIAVDSPEGIMKNQAVQSAYLGDIAS
jgi:branched-chain amino acid transport system ATP-binding protein